VIVANPWRKSISPRVMMRWAARASTLRHIGDPDSQDESLFSAGNIFRFPFILVVVL
jgi:hypothetical protein